MIKKTADVFGLMLLIVRRDPVFEGPVRLRTAELGFPLTLGIDFHPFLNYGNRAIRRNHHDDNVLMFGREPQGRVIARSPGTIFTGNRSAVEKAGKPMQPYIGADVQGTVYFGKRL